MTTLFPNLGNFRTGRTIDTAYLSLDKKKLNEPDTA